MSENLRPPERRVRLKCQCGRQFAVARAGAETGVKCPSCGRVLRTLAAGGARNEPNPPCKSGRPVWVWPAAAGACAVIIATVAVMAVSFFGRGPARTVVSAEANGRFPPGDTPETPGNVADSDSRDRGEGEVPTDAGSGKHDDGNGDLPTPSDGGDPGAEVESVAGPPAPPNVEAPIDPGEASGSEPDTPLDILAFRKGVAAFLETINSEGNEKGLVFPLHSQRKVVDVKTVEYEVRYRSVTVTVPVYRYQYKMVEMLVPVKEGSVTVMKKVQRRQTTGRVKVGERQVQRHARDENGDIVKTHRRNTHVYGPGGPDIQPVGWAGNNGFALYALLEAGVSPAEEPGLAELARTLDAYCRVHGLPDYTWDVAGLIAGLSHYPSDEYDYTIRLLLGRLLSGQCTSREKPGLWGPLCVSADHLAKILEASYAIETYSERVEAVARSPQGRNNPSVAQERQKVTDAREAVAGLFAGVSRSAHRFIEATYPLKLDDELEEFSHGMWLPGWPYNLYQETLGDLQSTAVAVFALRVAHEQDRLPDEVTFEHLRTVDGKPMMAPIKPQRILKDTLATLADAQDAQGRWDEMIVWEETGPLAPLIESIKGKPRVAPGELPSLQTPISQAQGVAAMEDLLAILGDDFRKRYADKLSAGREQLLATIEDVLATANDAPKPSASSIEVYREFAPRAGGLSEPFDCLFWMRLHGDEEDEAVQRLSGRMLNYLIAHQQADGPWSIPGRHFAMLTPALRQWSRRQLAALRQQHEEEGRKWPNDMRMIQFVLRKQWWLLTPEEADQLASLYAILTLAPISGPLEHPG